MINTYFSIYVLIVSILSANNSNACQISFEENPEISSLMKEITPSRTQALSVAGKKETFWEYYLSSEDNACGFRLFNHDRKSAINFIRSRLTDPFVKECIKNSLDCESENTLKDIFKNDSNKDKNQEITSQTMVKYLDFVKSRDHMMTVIETSSPGSAVNKNIAKDRLTLLDALAYLQKKNFYIYTQDSNGQLRLFHCFEGSGFTDSVRGIYKKNHYNHSTPHLLL